ncbi:MAG: hypothetical protein CLLPBCKN_003245 [Chroococcidiopsis cubana SAG 39.79]|uniref:OCP N-terminal domain-containing protein n=1 Tax=Chroococcidiopsis cubana SAG 39.79 TaxID=388085 RepID=A0AB37UQ24_9CYAN|nr:orange carotenoid protein N-terminal domain-containing protein [Chroococcidiopsis cubana]MDZ4873849.1 hypothetical protein [Chroococcidiopsis cubana SAG 39.79]PSB65183.1 Orange carotenoid-binding protein [Chroococcidiopsis cubana CCALA 043]RUT13485.1 hypothetical protein DSM107010_11080 [Chroococcidiopsis cubana SAG 39.79]
MAFTNVNDLKPLAKQFTSLDIDDQLGVMALIYIEIASSIPSDSLPTSSSDVQSIVGSVQKMSSEEQINALRDLLPANKTDQDETMLDPNPAKALPELLQGKSEVPTGEYGKLNPESKLAVWYLFAQKLGNGIVAIPSDYSPSAEAMQVFNSLKSMGQEQMANFVVKGMEELSSNITEPPKNAE